MVAFKVDANYLNTVLPCILLLVFLFKQVCAIIKSASLVYDILWTGNRICDFLSYIAFYRTHILQPGLP